MKQAMRLLGVLVAIAAGYYFLRQAAAAWNGVNLSALLSWRSAAFSCAALFIYLVQIPLATFIWRWILGDMGVRLPMAPAYAVIASTQFAKYLPGNVAQHIGRVAVARGFGGDLSRLALSLVYENVIALLAEHGDSCRPATAESGRVLLLKLRFLLIALLAGIHVTVVFLSLRPTPTLEQWLPMGSKSLLLTLATVGAGLLFLLLPRLIRYAQRKRGLDTAVGDRLGLSAARLLLAYGAFIAAFLLLGFSFTLVMHAVAPGSGFPFLPLCGAFAAAWVIGLLVPGAPAGLGVREGVLIALLGGVTGGAAGVAAISLLRVVTTLGDFLHFLAGTWLLRKTLPKPPPAGGT